MEWYNYVLPPLLGAIIGYVTNYIAIKMLFRPHNPIMIGPLRLPFTPGIIPKKRDEIAINIGKMVGQVLLDEESLRIKIQSKNIYDGIYKAVDSQLEVLLEREVDTIASLVPSENQQDLENTIESIKKQIQQSLMNYLKGDDFSRVIKEFLSQQVEAVLTTQMGQIVNYDTLPDTVYMQIENIINTDKMVPKLLELLKNQLFQLQHSNTTIIEILPEEVTEHMVQIVEDNLPSITYHFTRAINDSEIKYDLMDAVKGNIIALIDDLSRFQRFIVSMIQVEALLDEMLPKYFDKLIEDVGSFFKKRRNVRKLRNFLNEQLQNISTKSIADIFGRLDTKDINALYEILEDRIEEIAKNKETKKVLANLIVEFLQDFRNQNIQQIIDSYYENGSQRLILYIYERAIDYFQKEDNQEQVFILINQQIDYLVYDYKWGRIGDVIQIKPEQREKIARLATDTIVKSAIDKLPQILEAVDLEGVVVEKVNNYPVAEVENLLMVVISKHLKWINIFGAILGSIIGFSQLALQFLR